MLPACSDEVGMRRPSTDAGRDPDEQDCAYEEDDRERNRAAE